MTATKITPEMVKELRERTGVSMGQCKKALDEAHGDMEQAFDNLRKAGIASIGKKEGRETKEGMIGFAETADAVALLEINAETDFVVKNEKFIQFVQEVVNEAAQTKPASLEAFMKQTWSKDSSLTVDQHRALAMQSMGENIQVKRLEIFPKAADVTIGLYSHMGGKIVTLVEITGSQGEEGLARDIAMHVAAKAPDFLNPEAIPQDVKERETEIAKAQVVGKPANIVDKIVEGKLKAFYDQVCLLCQEYIKDDTLSIAALVAKKAKETGKPLSVTRFAYWKVGA